MSKIGGNLGEQGCVNWMFEKKGTITLSSQGLEENTILEQSLNLGAEDFQVENDLFVIKTSPEEFGKVSKGLEEQGYEINGELGLTPINQVKINGPDAKKMIELLDILEEHEDIQKVYSNFDLDDSEMEAII
jgi:transcriptional/translational regulatory protein YebC/TACO1